MNIINYLSKNKDQFIENYYESLSIKVNFFQLDCSRGETDLTTIAFIEKENLTFHEAISILLIRFKMYDEEWNDFENYTKEDINRWIKMLEKEYANSTYQEKISENEFRNNYLVERLSEKNTIKLVKLNDDYIYKEDFEKSNPLNEKLKSISTSTFKNLSQEYYLETVNHFIIFNWFTTA